MNNVAEKKEIFIKNTLDVDSDGLKGTVRYVVKSMFDVIHTRPDGSTYATIGHRIIEDVTLAWDEIEQEGGPGEIRKQLQEIYNV